MTGQLWEGEKGGNIVFSFNPIGQCVTPLFMTTVFFHPAFHCLL